METPRHEAESPPCGQTTRKTSPSRVFRRVIVIISCPFLALIRYGGNREAVATILGTKTVDMVNEFYTKYEQVLNEVVDTFLPASNSFLRQ